MTEPDFREELNHLRQRATDLENELFMLRARLRHLERKLPDAPAAEAPAEMGPAPDATGVSPGPQGYAGADEQVESSDEDEPVWSMPPVVLQPTTGGEVSAAADSPAERPAPPAAPPVFTPAAVIGAGPAPHRPGMEEIIGQRWLNRVGAVILFLALAFFVKYSFDRGLISPLLRVVLGGAAGVALVAVGEFCAWRSMRQFSMGLLGAGVGVLYLAVFGAYNFYHLVTPHTAAVLYIAVTLLSVAVAVHGDMLVVAILAMIGGYATPLALSTGANAQVALLTYVLFLDVGFLLCAHFRRWEIVRVLAWLGTLGLFGGWFLTYYGPEARWTTWGFLAAFYLLFHAELFVAVHRGRVATGWLAAAMLRADNVVFFGGTYLLWREAAAAWLGLFAVLSAAAQWLPAWSLRKSEARPASSARLAYWLDGAAMLALAAPLQFDRYLVSVSWSIQAAVTCAFCRRYPDVWLRVKAFGVLIAAVVHLLVFERTDAALVQPLVTVGLWYWTWFLSILVGWALCGYASALLLGVRRQAGSDDRLLAVVVVCAATGVLLWAFADAWDRYLASWWWLGLAVLWLAVSRYWPRLVWLSGALVVALVCKVLCWDLGAAIAGRWQDLAGVVANRAVLTGLLTAGAAVLADRVVLRGWRRAGSPFAPPAAPGVFIVVAALVLVWTGTFEIARMFRFEDTVLARFAHAESVGRTALTGFWLVAALALWLVPRVRRSPLAVFTLVLTAAAVIRVLAVDTLGMVLTGRWAHLSGICTNRVFAVGMLAALAVWVAYRRVRRLDMPSLAAMQGPLGVVALLVLAVLVTWTPTFEIARTFRYEALRERFADARLAMHVAVSVLWSLNATLFLAIGFLRRLPPLRYAALVLYLGTVIKVFLFDMAHLEMVYRIISFMVLGVLLILGSLLYQRYGGRLVPLVQEGTGTR